MTTHDDAHAFLGALLALRPGDEVASLLAEYLRPPPWHGQAACRNTGVNTFFTGNTDVALALCQRCVVRLDCLSHAVDNNELHGVWGGTTEKERRAIRSSGRLPRPAADEVA